MRNSPQDVHKKVLGRTGEKRAERYLKQQGYKIIALNFRTPFGEADIVALDKDTYVFAEVKTRNSDRFGTPAEAVGRSKQKTYIKIAGYFLSKLGREDVNIRFDVLEVEETEIRHLISAFTA